MAQLFAGDGDKKSRFSGEGALKPVKPLRRECRSASAEPVCSCAFSFAQLCTRDRGCSAHPAFPAPSSHEGQRNAKLGQNRAARMRTHIRCLKFESENIVVPDERMPLL